MTTVTRSIQVFVHAPLQITFNYVSDLTRHPEWNGGLSIEALTPGPVAVGKEYGSQGVVAVQKDRPNTVRVSQYEPVHKFGFIAKDPDFGPVSHVFVFDEQNGGVMITRTMTVNLSPIVAIAFRLFVYPLIGNPSMKKSFAALKARLEGSQ
jgi:uncharacterized protein YndB with AHSA1/START domain